VDAEDAQVAFSGSAAPRASRQSAQNPRLDAFSSSINARAWVDEGELNSYEFF
jgi:hypothetical protein